MTELRLAASLLIIRDDPLEILMLRRGKGGTFSSALVFPGGLVNEGDHEEAWLDLSDTSGLDPADRILRIAALRETFEETGLLALDRDSSGALAGATRYERPFIDTVRESGGKLATGGLTAFAHWITPAFAPKRFDTHFYLLSAPEGQIATADGHESVSLAWRRPADVLAEDEGLPFPTRLNLIRLAESSTVEAAFEAARARPPFTVLPELARRADGDYVVIPAAAGYALTEEKRAKLQLP